MITAAEKRPFLLKEWDYKKNAPLTPEMVSYGSNRKVWWICNTCGCEWKSAVKNRSSGQGCPKCSLEIRGKKKSQNCAINNGPFYQDKPELLEEWNKDKNEPLNPKFFSEGSSKTIWWICSNNHEWKAKIKDRVKGNGCPVCSGKTILPGFNDLYTLRPDLLKEWDSDKNTDITPSGIGAGSGKKVWWKCKKGHEWLASVDSRARGRGCPVCAGRLVIAGVNDLMSQNPQLTSEWNYERNTNLSPASIHMNSDRKVWWNCKLGHEWQASVYVRTKGHGCPYCSNLKVLSGFNDLKTTRPDLAVQWNYQKNKDISPSDVSAGTSKKVWWKCNTCGNEWKAEIASRSNGAGCPVCGRKKILDSGNKTRLKKSGSLAKSNPELIKEWNYEKNGELTPETVTPKSNKKVWWICSKGHEWQSTIVNRNNLGRGCPYCSNQLPSVGENDFKTLHPELAEEWHPIKNSDFKPYNVTSGSNKQIWWICPLGHEYKATIKNRVSRESGCPYCSGKRVLKGFNDFETKYPNLAREWDIDKNNGLLPSDVTFGSGRKVWWRCQYGHSFPASVCNRAQGRGCPVCSDRMRTSFPEQAIYFYLSKAFPDTVNGTKEILGNKMELDVFIPSISTAVEYDGKAFHYKDENQKRDKQKYLLCKENKIHLIRIREITNNPGLEETCDYHIDIPDGRNIYLKSALEELSLYLGKTVDIDLERDKDEIFGYLTTLQKSLESEFPEIAEQWHPIKNGSLLPSMFHPGSNEKVWWFCKKCGNEWKTSIYERTGHDKTECPVCSRMQRGRKNIETRIRKNGSLASTRPDLMEEWLYEKNDDISPEQVTCGSGRKVWWKCNKCGFEWMASINHRTNGRGCPRCKRKKKLKPPEN